MYYVATAGKKKGKILNLDESEFDHETGLVKDDEGNTYRIDSIRPLTKELMIENGLLDEFTECVEKGIFSPLKETEQYFINWDLLKSYKKDQSSNTANKNTTKIIADMAKEIADLKKENRYIKEQLRILQNERNAKETKDEVDELLEQIILDN